MHTGFKLMIAVILLVGVSSCYYDNEEDLYRYVKTDCDTLNVTYAGTISPIMQTYCNGCHSASAPSAGIITSTHAGLQAIALNGSLYGSMSHASAYSPMPKNSPKLTDCPLAKVRIWVAAGAPNN
jgi:hypothetical protein